MKKITQFILIVTILLTTILSFPSKVSAAPLEDDRTIFGSGYTLESGRILDGNLNVIGGVVEIEKDATINGKMFVMGGVVNINGTVNGDLTVIAGTVTLEEYAVINGNLVSPGSYINRDPGAVVNGSQIKGWNFGNQNFSMPHPWQTSPWQSRFQVLPIITRIGRGTLFTLLMVALGALLLLIMPKSVERMGRALEVSPWQALAYGVLTALVMAIGGVIFSITICLIPVVLLVGLAFSLAVLAGWLVLGYELGKRIETNLFKTSWHPVLSAVVGNLVLFLVAQGLNLIPCLGWFLILIATFFGLGSVILTLFGTKSYPASSIPGVEQQIILNETSELSQEDPV